MNEEAERLFKALKSEVIDLHLRWLTYRQLYAGGETDVELLNRSGSNVFYLLQFLLLDDIALRIAKLTDPPYQRQFENLSLGRLAAALPPDDEDFVQAQLRPAIKRVEDVSSKFRELRNKRVAHLDLSHAIGLADPPLPGISLEDVECALGAIRDATNAVELHFSSSQTAYALLIVPLGSDGHRLLRVLRAGLTTLGGATGVAAESPDKAST